MFNNTADIIDFLADLPKKNSAKLKQIEQRNNILTKPIGSLGKLEDIMCFMASWQNCVNGDALKFNPEIHVFAGNHGIVKEDITPFPSDVTMLMVDNFKNGGACINQISNDVGANLNVHVMNELRSTNSFFDNEAMTKNEMIDAINVGYNAALKSNGDIIAVGEMGIGNTSSGSAMCLGLYGGDAKFWVGHGTGSYGDLFEKKISVISESYNLHKNKLKCPFDVLRIFGGFELAGIVGIILGARVAGKPVVIDGFTTTVCGAILHKINDNAIKHCIVSHKSCEFGHMKLLEKIGMTPLLDLNLRLGEASGAALCLHIIKSAVSSYNNMATFEDIGIEI